MSESLRLRQLRRNLRDLRRELLPEKFSNTGAYSQRQSTRALAFRVLAHAEVEAYLEDRVRELALAAIAAWKSSTKATPVLAALVAFVGRDLGSVPDVAVPAQPTQMASWPDKIELSQRLQNCVNTFIKSLDENHGVKEKNLLRMLLPVGVPAGKLHATLLADMNSFGAKRGEAAHGARVQQIVDPEQELKTVNALFAHLALIDAELDLLQP